jgi:cellulose synthase/poly-beta-1,6-N-acetylglucosamine synthase-like glycosyltransferase
VVFLAGLSQGLGQSVVLFANRIKPRRFAFSLLVSAVIYVFGFLFSVLSIWLIAKVVFDKSAQFKLIISVVGLSYAPFLLGFFILTPHLGSFFNIVLSLWRLTALLIALEVTLGLTLWQALICSLLAWLFLAIVERTIGRPIQGLSRTVKRVAAGKKLEEIKTIFLKRNSRLKPRPDQRRK